MSQGTHSTKQKLMDVAEELFATKGIAATLVGDIVQGAGQRNPSALRYHFGSRDALLQAIREKYLVQLEERRTTLYTEWPAPGPSTARDAVSITVIPLVELLRTEPGRRYLRILGQTLFDLDPGQMSETSRYPSLAKTLALMESDISDAPIDLVGDRVRGCLLMITGALATTARDITAGRRAIPGADYQQNVIAMATAALTAPIDSQRRHVDTSSAQRVTSDPAEVH